MTVSLLLTVKKKIKIKQMSADNWLFKKNPYLMRDLKEHDCLSLCFATCLIFKVELGPCKNECVCGQ